MAYHFMNNPYEIKILDDKNTLELHFENNVLVGRALRKTELDPENKKFPLPKTDRYYAETFADALQDFSLDGKVIYLKFKSNHSARLSEFTEHLAEYFSCLLEPITNERYQHILKAMEDESENGEPRHDGKSAFRCPYCKKFLYGKDKKGYTVPTEGYFTCAHVAFIVVDGQIEYQAKEDFQKWFETKMDLEGDYWDFLKETPFSTQMLIGTQSEVMGEIWGFNSKA